MTKKADAMYAVMDSFIDYYQKANGALPPRIRLTKKQAEDLRIRNPETKELGPVPTHHRNISIYVE